VLYLGVENGDFLESFIVSDTLKDNSKESFAALKEQNVDNLIILSGDEEGIVKQVGEDLGATEALGSLLPDEKLEHIQKWKEDKNLVSFVGDGINDSPSLLASDIGISMGSLGSDAAIEASDVVITDDNLMKIPEAKRLAKRTMWIVKLCIAVSILLKVLFMVLVLAQVLGPLAMIISAVSDTGVMVICVLIAISLLTYKPKYKTQTKAQN
jgi:Cd2+/Zn2+-exporting ATPase